MNKDQKPKILVVDDQQANLFAMNALFNGMDVEVDLVNSGKSAISKVIRNDYALILLDIQMPDLDGFDTARIIRSNASSEHTPIIFLTAYSTQSDSIKNGYDVGGVEYISKPFDSDILLAKVHRFTEMHMKRHLTEMKNGRLEKSNIQLSQFVQIASHDLKEPLRGILLHADLLKENRGDNISKEELEAIDHIVFLAKKQTALIKDLSKYSKASIMEETLHNFDFDTTAHDIADTIIRAHVDKNIKINIQPKLPRLHGDRTKIGEVLRNLISNGIKYNENDQIAIDITFSKKNSSSYTFCIKDNGIGIDPKHHDRIFAIFKRLNPEGKYGEGTGAGLSIVRKIIEGHNGKITLDSNVGEGCKFYITLPSAT